MENWNCQTISIIRFDRFDEQGDFLNRDRAIEELLTMGLKSYEGREEVEEPVDDEFASQAFEEQVDPALRDDDGDEMI